jgi:hypothetical protein
MSSLLCLYSIGIIRFELITDCKDTKIFQHHLVKCNFSAVHSFHFAHSCLTVYKNGSKRTHIGEVTIIYPIKNMDLNESSPCSIFARDVAVKIQYYLNTYSTPCLTVNGIPRRTKGNVHCINQEPSYDTYLITLSITVRRHPHDFLFRLQSYKLYAIFQYKISPNVFLGEIFILFYFCA